MKERHCYSTTRRPTEGILLPAALFSLLLLTAFEPAMVFAGGSGAADPRTFGAYQVDLDCGPVGITIQGHSSTQVVKVREENIPPEIRIRYSESGGILHVAVASTGKPESPVTPVRTARLVVSMPRYEFVHIVTTSGDVSIDNLSTDHLTIQTATGGIDVVDTNAALTAKSTTGNQRYTQIYGSIDAASIDGDLAVDHTWGTMNLSSATGSLAGRNVAVAGGSSFRTTSGSIKMSLAYGLGRYTFDGNIVTTSGDVSIDNLSTDHLTIQTATGGIDVVDTNAALTAKSTTGNQRYTQIYGSIDAASIDGDLAVDHTWGTMNLSSATGSLAGRNVAVAGGSSFRTTSGSIERRSHRSRRYGPHG